MYGFGIQRQDHKTSKMKMSSVIIAEYNFWLNHFQLEVTAMQENGALQSTILYVSEKLRKNTSKKLLNVAELAYYSGDSDLAILIHDAAQRLGSDALIPEPM